MFLSSAAPPPSARKLPALIEGPPENDSHFGDRDHSSKRYTINNILNGKLDKRANRQRGNDGNVGVFVELGEKGGAKKKDNCLLSVCPAVIVWSVNI